MPTQPYYVDGERVPGVTTALKNIGWSTDPLMYWAWKEGQAGRDFRQTGGKAADVGTIAHAMFEAYVHDRPYEPPADVPGAILDAAQVPLTAAQRWWQDTRLTVVATELALVSPTRRVGGTLDLVCVTARGELCIPDVKTSNGTYPDHWVQVRTYGALFEELTGLEVTGGYYIARFDKESGGFSVKWLPAASLGCALEAFECARRLHELKPQLQRLCR